MSKGKFAFHCGTPIKLTGAVREICGKRFFVGYGFSSHYRGKEYVVPTTDKLWDYDEIKDRIAEDDERYHRLMRLMAKA